MERVEHEFDPVFDENSKVLILGSFPSVKSREISFYYGHKRNRFWKIISELTGEKTPENTDDKKEMLLRNKIAVWDVIKSCRIEGSSDSSIKDVEANDINHILKHSNIKKVYTNGGKAHQLYKKYCQKDTGIEDINLPSTSPANASYSLEKLMDKWIIIKEDINI